MPIIHIMGDKEYGQYTHYTHCLEPRGLSKASRTHRVKAAKDLTIYKRQYLHLELFNQDIEEYFKL